MDHQMITITPELAAEYLRKNTGNRPQRPAQVRYFEEQLRSGRARSTHQGIAFDTNGMLQDGQHRLQAIVNTGIAWTLPVFTDCAPENFNVIDSGSKRTLADLLSIRGYKNTKHLAAVTTLAWQWERGRASFTGKPMDEQLAEICERYPAIQDAEKLTRTELGCSQSVLSFMGFIADSAEFVADLMADVPDESTAGGRLTEGLTDRHRRKLTINRRTLFAVFIKARNDHHTGVRPDRRYSFRSTEAFPTPVWGPPIAFDVRHNSDDDDDEG